MSTLEIRRLTHVFPNGIAALNNISFSVRQGEFVIIAGANGSGKTVLLRHFNGLYRPTGGQVLLDGMPVMENLTEARKKIGLIFQNPDSQIVGQTVAEDVAFGPENLNLSRQEVDRRVAESLAAVGLTGFAARRPHTLSGGQKRRLAIAGVLAMKPQIIVFDEPFAGLDYPGVSQVLKQIVTLHKTGHTIIMATHELEKTLAHATRLLIMEKGQVVRDGDPVRLIDEVELYGVKKPYGGNRRIESMTWLN